jgi:hypothetical protein
VLKKRSSSKSRKEGGEFYKVTDGHGPVLHALRTHDHGSGQRRAEDQILSEVEPGQAALCLERGGLVVPEALVVPLRLVLLIVEVLYGLHRRGGKTLRYVPSNHVSCSVVCSALWCAVPSTESLERSGPY